MPINIQEDNSEQKDVNAFGKAEEQAIISLAFDQPEFFSAILQHLRDEHFEQYETKFIFNIIKFYHEKHNVIITRPMAIDIAEQQLVADDPHAEIIALIKRELDPRDEPIITERLIEWARKKQYGLLYSQEALDAHERGDYTYQDKVIEDARRITKFGTELFWFFDQYEQLFIEDTEERLTTGFDRLDHALNNGGPVKKEVLCFLAPTNVGKSIAIENVGVANIKRNKNVLHVTLEMSKEQMGRRYLGTFTQFPVRKAFELKNEMTKSMISAKATNTGRLIIAEYPPDEVSADTIHALLDSLRRVHGIRIDVLLIDYLELMIPCKRGDENEYFRQKQVSTEITRLAVKENIFVVTASQSNRSGLEPQDSKKPDKVIDLDKSAESFGKNMPLSYVITINQTKQEYEEGRQGQGDGAPVTSARCRFYIAKNRNGPKFCTIQGVINYETMTMREQQFGDVV